MRIILDTHLFLWWIKGDAKLAKKTRSKILDATEVYVSSASIWECAIKIKLKKLDVDIKELVAAIEASNFIELPITAEHAAKVIELPDLHRDPFDRILVAQAICEPLILLTADKKIGAYSDLVEVISD
jgi:PIN domain nuclease of toxin-antitoxin system